MFRFEGMEPDALRSTSGGGARPRVDPPDEESDLVLLREALGPGVEARTKARAILVPCYRERLLAVLQSELPGHPVATHEELVGEVFSELDVTRQDGKGGKRDTWSEFPVGKKWFARWAVTEGARDVVDIVRATRGLTRAELNLGRGRLQFHTHERILTILASRLPGYSHERREELLQQTFAGLYEDSSKVAGAQWCDYDKTKARFTTWVAGRALKDSIDAFRKELRRERLLAWVGFSPSTGFSPQQVLMGWQQTQVLRRALERLESQERELLLDHYGSDLPGYEREGASFPELAERYGKSEDALKKRAERARRKLQALLLEEAGRELFTEEES